MALALCALTAGALLQGSLSACSNVRASSGMRSAVGNQLRVCQPRLSENTPAEPDTIFTMQERQDGWDDVRSSIKKQIKDRRQAYDAIAENYVAPTAATLKTAGRWAKVLAEEASGVELKAPTMKLDGRVVPTRSAKDTVISVIASFADAAAERRQRDAQRRADK
jgi:hypothetical protein